MKEIYKFYNDNQLFVLSILFGALLIWIGIYINTYRTDAAFLHKYRQLSIKPADHRWLKLVDRVTSIFPFNIAKAYIKSCLSLRVTDDYELSFGTTVFLALLVGFSGGLLFLLKEIGQLWYVKALIYMMSIILPFYVFGLIFDLYKYSINKNIPVLIDEFRSAFINNRKIKPAMLECSQHINKDLGKLIRNTADSPFIEDSLNELKNKLNNIWFNIFVTLLINFKENSGDLVDQLYKLNRTMTRYSNVEKKKNRKLIWYEMFAVMASVLSIPAVFWINGSILSGQDMSILVDAQTNIIISRIIGYSILSLIIIRILRSI